MKPINSPNGKQSFISNHVGTKPASPAGGNPAAPGVPRIAEREPKRFEREDRPLSDDMKPPAEQRSEPRVEPKPLPQQAQPQPQPQALPKPQAQPQPQLQSQPQPQIPPQPQPRLETQPQPQLQPQPPSPSQPPPQLQSQPQPQLQSRPQPQPQLPPLPQGGQRPQPGQESPGRPADFREAGTAPPTPAQPQPGRPDPAGGREWPATARQPARASEPPPAADGKPAASPQPAVPGPPSRPEAQPAPLQPHELGKMIFDFERDVPPSKDVDAAARLVRHLQANGFEPESRDAMGNTLLMHASMSGNEALASYLLNSFPGLSPHALNSFGQNAAMMAMASGHPEILALLQKAGVQLEPDNLALTWYLQNRADLSVASQVRDWKPLAALLSQENFMNLRDANGRTLMFHAAMNADLEAVRFLCGCLTTPFLGWKDAYGNSVFRYTTRIADVELGKAICQELRALRRKTRSLYKYPKREWETDWCEPRLHKREKPDMCEDEEEQP